MHSHTTVNEPDRARKAPNQEDDLDALAKRLRVSRESVDRAVKAVGNSAPAIERYLVRFLYEGCA